ncbi:DUF3987 domain-containing protein [Pontibacter silvestris]|uniref:DUF3987 domain-containing protein n=1 Tax=Pontibacter silvestris TaxID=2305183 RepID=A0ABW4X1H4_9BACT|nr:DUF3987 domain-containing protein [Pontibacter silvestris]MCC9138717.1 DUF3987 domain-containing protein [Pontibacter silvestris]
MKQEQHYLPGQSNALAPDFSQADRLLEELRKEPTPAPLKAAAPEKPEANPFPIEAFPPAIQRIIRATNNSLRFPVDFTATSMLCAAATAIGNSHTAHVKPTWQEGAVLYAALVAPPGSNKSHPLDFAFAPLSRRDDEAYHRYAQERREYELLQGMLGKDRNNHETEGPREPVLSKTLVSDFTQEALTVAHSHNTRGVCAVVDELAGFVKNLNRYNSGGDVEFWLSAWSSKTVSVDRLKRMPVRIRRPFIPIVGTIQNGVLLELARNGKSDNGFLDRFLFAMPEGVRKERWSDSVLDEAHTRNWANYMAFLLELKMEVDEWETPVPRQLRFSPEAWLRLQEWQGTNTDLCNDAESEALKGVYTKLEVYTIRFALILQLLAWACCEAEKAQIELKAVEGAILLSEYFRRTARVVQRIVHNEDPLDRYNKRKRELYEQLPQQFSTADGLRVAEQMDMPERTFKKFLTEKNLFTRPEHGRYEKLL